MTQSRTLTPRKFIIALGSLAAALACAPAAQAGPLVASAPDCDDQELAQVFLPWLDPAHYTLAPNGGFESGSSKWDLSGGAQVAHGNESHYVGGANDSRSLSLPAGSSATSAAMCVGIEHPTLRIFARNTGSPLGTMEAEVLFEDADGNVRSLTIGVFGAGPSWEPTAVMPIVANLLPLLPGDHTPVAFRFTPHGGNWQIDDVYVDPYRRS